MATRLVHVGFGNYVAADRIVSVRRPDTAPVQRLVREGKPSRLIIDVTGGRRTRAVLLLDTGNIVLAALSPRSLSGRVARVLSG
jgi:regulator of extracellular matrix RemA (YlzA/DUF370 family)